MYYLHKNQHYFCPFFLIPIHHLHSFLLNPNHSNVLYIVSRVLESIHWCCVCVLYFLQILKIYID